MTMRAYIAQIFFSTDTAQCGDNALSGCGSPVPANLFRAGDGYRGSGKRMRTYIGVLSDNVVFN